MRIIIYPILGIAAISVGIAFYNSQQPIGAVPPAELPRESPPIALVENNPTLQPEAPAPVPSSETIPAITSDSNPVVAAAAVESTTTPVDPVYKQAMENLLSPLSSHEQRRAALKQLNDAGKLDQAISELQQQTANNPGNAAYPTALGQALLEKARSTEDNFPDKAIFAMQAVKSFDAALQIDPSNWEARFTKTSVMSHYPAELNKGQEVIDQFTQLINQQEALPPQPQFAATYVLLGDQYLKLGKEDYALATWQAGAALFPGDSTLHKRLTQPASR